MSAVRHALVLLAALVVCGAAGAGAFPGGDGLIVFSRDAGGAQPELVVLDPATGAQRTLGAGTAPAWSPDGTRLAFVRDGIVYVSAADGSNATPIGEGDDPAWSPDGTRLAVARYDGKVQPDRPRGTLQLVVLDLAGGAPKQLTDGTADALLPAWSPDGATIAYATPTALATVPATGGAGSSFDVPGLAPNGGPSWSPDGARLALVDALGQVWTVGADGSGGHQLTYGLVAPTSRIARPAWSPDGRSIAFASGSDLCVTDLSGSVQRLTRTPATDTPVVAALPDWRPGGGGGLAAPPARSDDAISCDWNPGARIEILPVNLSPAFVSVAAPKLLVFVNHLDRPVTVTTSARAGSTVVGPGRAFGFSTKPGEYEFSVSGYPDGVPRRGTVVVTAAGSITIDAHGAIRYGSRTLIGGVAAGDGRGPVTVTARPAGSRTARRVATVTPARGRWSVSVAPRVSTTYRVSYGTAAATRLLRVMPALRVRRAGQTVTAALTPSRPLAGRSVYLFRSRGRGWSEYRRARVGRDGTAFFRGVPTGRFYVAFAGGETYWSTASEPFTVRR